MATVQVAGVNGALINAVEEYRDKHDLDNSSVAWRELTRRGLQSVENEKGVDA